MPEEDLLRTFWCAVPKAISIHATHLQSLDEDYQAVEIQREDLYRQASRFVHRGVLGCSAGKRGRIDHESYEHIVSHERTILEVEKMEQEQFGDILIIPVKLAVCPDNMTGFELRATLSDNEFGLGVLAVISIALTNLMQISFAENVALKCIGDDWVTVGGSDKEFTPAYNLDYGVVRDFVSHRYEPAKKTFYLTAFSQT